MDVLNPETYFIDDRCYRKNPCRRDTSQLVAGKKFWSSSRDFSTNPSLPQNIGDGNVDNSNKSLASNRPYVENDDDDAVGDDNDIETIENGFKSRVDIPPALYAVLIGVKGQTKGRIERDTGTKIVVPRQNEKGTVMVRGQKIRDVIAAKKRIFSLVSQARGKRDPTHFLCFPLNSASIIASMKQFKKEVLEECTGVGSVDGALFVDAEKSHLTLAILTLFDEGERTVAANLLAEMQQEIQKNFNLYGNSLDKISVRLKGLEIMNDDPTAVDVLYAKVDLGSNKSLQDIADFASKRFIESGFSRGVKGQQQVKLHCTLMNSKKKAETISNGDKNYLKRETFDASLILSKFRDFDFGVVEISDIVLATRYTVGADGFYKISSSIKL